ncbi:hypothetical protein ACDA63_07380 [Uliginosibacterium sp. sgz301328]
MSRLPKITIDALVFWCCVLGFVVVLTYVPEDGALIPLSVMHGPAITANK